MGVFVFVSQTMADILKSWVQTVVPQPCYDEFFIEYNLLHAACLKTVISKCLGLGIILGSVLVKIPQILKIVSSKSGEGISMSSVTLELIAITASLAYNYAQGYPFSAWGESMFLSVQTILIAFFVLAFSGHTVAAALYTGMFGAVTAFLLAPSTPRDVLWLLQASVIPITVTSRMIQAVQNLRNGSTGQLSAITIFLLFLGAVARVFTSIQETGDEIIILTYVVSACCNAILAFQILWYWNADKVKSE